MSDSFRPPRPPTFETKRLRLRTLQPGDEEFLAALDSDPDVMQYIHLGPLSQKIAMKWAEAQIEMAPHRWHLHKWIAELRDHRTSIGWIELGKFRGVFDPDESRIGDDVSLGYQFVPAYWNQGFASEAVRPVLDYAFDTLELDRVVAFVHTANNHSVRLLERLGFHQHPTGRHKDEGGNECFLYALVKNTWRH
jgi:RimJ/RimL family protein N-acetyltransferase